MKHYFILIILTLLPFCLLTSRASAQVQVAGHWEGVFVRDGSELSVTLDFTTDAGGLKGSFSAAAPRWLDIPLSNVRATASTVHFELVGDASSTVFEGTVTGETMTGEFREGQATGTFALRRAVARPLPYRQEEVRFQNGDVVLAGTLLVPVAQGPHPAVVFNHGSGPEGRFGSRFLADHVARHGIAALIYDKRGVGGSTGDWRRATFDDLAADAIAGVRFLQARREINPKKIGIYGHSQGGFIAPLIASRSKDVAFVISGASHGGPAYEQDIYRVRNALHDAGYSADDVTQAMVLYTLFIDVARTGDGWDRLDAAMQAARNEKWFAFLELPPKDHWIWQFYRGIGNYNPLPLWEKVSVPVLLIYGERDRLVPVAQSLANIEQALRKGKNSDYTMVILPKADHPLRIQPEPGQPFAWPYGAPGFPDLITAWLRLRVSTN